MEEPGKSPGPAHQEARICPVCGAKFFATADKSASPFSSGVLVGEVLNQFRGGVGDLGVTLLSGPIIEPPPIAVHPFRRVAGNALTSLALKRETLKVGIPCGAFAVLDLLGHRRLESLGKGNFARTGR